MTPTHWLYIGCAYLILFAVGIAGLAIWLKKRRKDRPPVAFKLLRGPGETLRRRLAKYDENSFLLSLAAAGIPPTAAVLVLKILVWSHPQALLQVYLGIGAAVVIFLATLYFSGRWVLRGLLRYSSDYLGYLGEREVAEHLVGLTVKGYEVFHDVPAEGAKKEFNLDHVAVGPNGVAVIEVKTRRKGRARPGFKDYVVIYDGKQLIWPWGEDRHGLDQAKAEAAWLHKWIEQRTGIDIPVKPILALPGWFVEMKALGDGAVVNSKVVSSAVEGKGPAILTADQIDLIARQLDLVCRDVVD